MLEEGEKEGLVRLLMAPVKGKEIVVPDVMVMLLPDKEQLRPDGREQVAAEVMNSAGKEMTIFEKGSP